MKGIAINTVVALVIGVIVLVVIVPLIFGVFKNIYTLILEKFGFISYSKVEKALICSNIICNWGTYAERAQMGCPLHSPMFKDFCYPFLIENGLYEEVCTLPSLFVIDPCSTMSIPIKVKVSSEEEGRFKEERIKNKINEFERKIRGLDFIFFEETQTIPDYAKIVFYYVIGIYPFLYIYWLIEFLTSVTNSMYIFRYELSTYVTQPKEILPGISIITLKEGEVKEGEYYIFSALYELRGWLTERTIIKTILLSNTPYLFLSDRPLEIEIDLTYIEESLEERYLRIFNNYSATGDFKKDNFFVAFKQTPSSNVVHVIFKYYNSGENRVNRCEFYLEDNGVYYCQVDEGYIKFNMVPTEDNNVKRVIISYTKQIAPPEEIVYIPPYTKDFCEHGPWVPSNLYDQDVNIEHEPERGRVVRVDADYNWGEAVYEYYRSEEKLLSLNAIDKVHICVKHHVNVSGNEARIILRFYDVYNKLSVDCGIFDIYDSYEKWVCKDINIRDDLYCTFHSAADIAKIGVVGYGSFSIDEFYLCKNC